MANEKTATQMDAEELERRMEKHLRFTCSFCPWEFEGPFGEGRAEAATHRSSEHPEAKQKRRRRGHAAPHLVRRPDLTQEELDAVEDERRRRALLNGVELSA